MSGIDPRIADAVARLPDYLGQHILVSAVALLIGIGVSLPLGIAAAHRPRLSVLVLGIASVVQTIPGLALLALFYPLLLALAALSQRLLGVSFSALGFLPAILALALYSMLPVLRNTVLGLQGIGRGLREAAAALCLTPVQRLRLIELPLALPLIMGGVRTAAVWVIGAATLSTPIGQTSLGNYIFTGLQTQNWIFVLVGCFAAAGLALVTDQLLALLEWRAAGRRPLAVVGLALALFALVIGAPLLFRAPVGYVIGGKPFGEQQVLGALVAGRLEAAGERVTRRDGLGSAVIFGGLVAGDVDVYVEYSGTLWANQMGRRDSPGRQEVLRETQAWLAARGVVVLGALGFENAYALVMTRGGAGPLGSLEELATRAPSLSIAGDYEFFGRPEWAALKRGYGLSFRSERQMQPVFMYQALMAGDVDVIAGYTSDGQIAQYDLVVLNDPKGVIPPYDALLLAAPKRAGDAALRAALAPLTGSIDVSLMRAANLRVDRQEGKETPEQAAHWLWKQIGSKR